MKDIETKLFNLEETKKYYKENKIKNIILFSQARSGSTFISNLLSEELGFNENFFPEEFFVDKHFSYLKKFVEKHDNFFISTNQFVYKRNELKKENTLHIYLHINSSDILRSYEKAKEKGFYLGWSEFYSKYRTLFPTLMNVEPITLFNHKIWETQVDSFEHGITLSYESFKDNPKFVNKKNRDEKFITLKQTDSNSNSDDFYLKYSKQKEIFEKKIKFNLIEKIYFKLRRLMESRKKDVKNY